MSKLLDRVVRLEGRLDNRNRVQFIEQNAIRLEEKVDALARHLGVEFKSARTVAIERKTNE